MSAMFKLIEHTADMGIEAHAESLSRLFEEVAQGLTAMIYADSTASPEISRSITLQADNKEELLVAWLNEILYWIDSDNIIPAGFEIDSLSDTELTASVVGECFDNQLDLWMHIGNVLAAMQADAKLLELDGRMAA